MKIIDKFLEHSKIPYIISGIIFLCSLGLLTMFKNAEGQLVELNQAVSFSHALAKSSDDLTNYGRYFVATKNEIWRTEYNNVLKIRNGVLPDENGIKKSFKERLKDGPFLQNELDILLKAEEQSNNLAKLENEAFVWIDKGKPEMVDDIQTHHFMAAQLLMFGDEYKNFKKEIILNTQKFYNAVDERLNTKFKFYMTMAWSLITIINLSLLLLVMIIIHKHEEKPVIKRKIIKKPIILKDGV